jgi:fructokinase
VVCWGEVLWDRFFDARRLGGAVANVAFHLAVLRVPVALVSRVGDDALGREAVELLAHAGVEVDNVQFDPERPTGQVAVAFEQGEPRYRLTPGCAWERIACDEGARRALVGADVLYYGTLCQRAPEGRAGLEQALAAAPKSCLRVCDPNFRPGHFDRELVRAALLSANLVKMNEGEARAVEEELGAGDAERWLIEQLGAELVAITRGSRGAVLRSATERVESPGFPVELGGDSVGCGDAFAAALIAGRLRGASLEAIGAAANRYAAFVASRPGAMPFAPGGLIDLLFRQLQT